MGSLGGELKRELMIGVAIGTIGMFVFNHMVYCVLLGPFAAVLAARQTGWQDGARIGALTGAVLAAIFVLLSQLTGLDGLATLNFAFFDHVLYLLILGGLGCAVLGVLIGAFTSQILLIFKKQ